MKIVNVIGGLGNQMSQYAFAVALKCKYPKDDVLVDTQLYQHVFFKTFRGNNFFHNGFEIAKIFSNASVPIAHSTDVKKVSFWIPNYIFSRLGRKLLPRKKTEVVQSYLDAYKYDDSIINTEGNVYFDGYWLSPKYIEPFKERVIETFRFPLFCTEQNKEYQALLEKDNSVTIHIRRGDYVGAENFKDICTLDYYRKAITKARERIINPEFFVFSNDQKWCMQNLKNEFGDAKVHFIKNNLGNENYRDMQLMSLARCNILANSSFSWWGAFLNNRKDQIVYVPHKWVNNLDDKDVYADSWIKVE